MQLLGTREPGVYGKTSYDGLIHRIKQTADELKIECCFQQSNHEGDIVDKIGSAMQDGVDGIVINPAAYTHTSIAIHDALKAVNLPAIEVHISNIHSRETFRNNSVTAPACIGIIAGLGLDSYEVALKALVKNITEAEVQQD
ncbi:MAG: 3-dehydroquinate dehydratase [Victivallaceae bacterium]|nr:3-dehydroquinate dehydratase [Victivallaceae bacterium]